MTQTPQPGAALAAPVVVSASALIPTLTALLRWLLTVFGTALVGRGLLSQGQADSLTPILLGLAMSLGALAWSAIQKQLAKRRIITAALTPPEHVVLR